LRPRISDNRAKAAVEGAAVRGLDHVDLPAEERVAAKHPHVAPRRPDLAVLEAAYAARGVGAARTPQKTFTSMPSEAKTSV
jgi:hypothetical protein